MQSTYITVSPLLSKPNKKQNKTLRLNLTNFNDSTEFDSDIIPNARDTYLVKMKKRNKLIKHAFRKLIEQMTSPTFKKNQATSPRKNTYSLKKTAQLTADSSFKNLLFSPRNKIMHSASIRQLFMFKKHHSKAQSDGKTHFLGPRPPRGLPSITQNNFEQPKITPKNKFTYVSKPKKKMHTQNNPRHSNEYHQIKQYYETKYIQKEPTL